MTGARTSLRAHPSAATAAPLHALLVTRSNLRLRPRSKDDLIAFTPVRQMPAAAGACLLVMRGRRLSRHVRSRWLTEYFLAVRARVGRHHRY